jgi:acyl-CoA synthetase (AMP-forming)/AMP-acid ligase II
MANQNLLQEVFKDRVGSGSVTYYPLGVTDPLTLSYADLYNHAQKNGAKIRSIARFKNLQPILLYFDTPLDTIIRFWSVLFSGGIPVILSHNLNHSHDQLQKLSALLHQPLCITTSSLGKIFHETFDTHVHMAEDIQAMEMAGNGQVSHLQHGASSTAVLMLTSGSTGHPKAVRLSHSQILAAVAGKAAVRPLTENMPFLNWIGLDHVASLVESIFRQSGLVSIKSMLMRQTLLHHQQHSCHYSTATRSRERSPPTSS